MNKILVCKGIDFERLGEILHMAYYDAQIFRIGVTKQQCILRADIVMERRNLHTILVLQPNNVSAPIVCSLRWLENHVLHKGGKRTTHLLSC